MAMLCVAKICYGVSECGKIGIADTDKFYK